MVKQKSFQFTNIRSVRFNLDSFALPVAGGRKKNSIYTNYLYGVRGTKRKLLPAGEPIDHHGYDYVARWGNWIFAANEIGLYYADQHVLRFSELDLTVSPQQLCVANNRLFLISQNRRRIVYSVDLNTDWSPANFLVAAIQIPDNYGLCLNIIFYRNNLLLICENGLLVVNKNLSLNHLSDDSELLKANLLECAVPCWESDWFSLGYATDTQNLREIFLKTNQTLTMIVKSNRTQRTIHIKAADHVQKIKTNLNGDQFKLIMLIEDGNNFSISDLTAIVSFGKRG